jgi:hypothetical protein
LFLFRSIPLKMDYAKHYRALIDRARGRRLDRQYFERHHIVPRCIGGGDEPGNLVRLTPEEHCVAHQLLAKMHPENEKLAYAAANMAGSAAALKMPRNKRYGRARRASAKRWGRISRGNAIRARKRLKRYSQADVARVASMLAPPQIPT